MRTIKHKRIVMALGLAAAVLAFSLLPACQDQAPPNSQKVAAMVIVVQDAVAQLSKELARPLAEREIKGIEFILKNYFSGAVQDARWPLKRVGVTDKNASIVTAYPSLQQLQGQNFSQYAVVGKVLQHRGISQEILFIPDSPEVFLICSPVLELDKVVGTVWFTLEADKVRETWGVSTVEFLKIDFNK